jgi:hypothetical protein
LPCAPWEMSGESQILAVILILLAFLVGYLAGRKGERLVSITVRKKDEED